MKISSGSMGMFETMSATRWMTESVAPPAKPLRMPSEAPISVEKNAVERSDEQRDREPVEKTLPQVAAEPVRAHDAEDRPAEDHVHRRELVLGAGHDNLHVDAIVPVQRVDAPGAVGRGNAEKRARQHGQQVAGDHQAGILLPEEVGQGVGGARLVGQRNPLRHVVVAPVRAGFARPRTRHGDVGETDAAAVGAGQADQDGRSDALRT